MNFIQHYSSSKSNLYEVQCSQRILIECGVNKKKLLKALNFKLDDIRCCLLTHSHADHSGSFRHIMANGIDLYTSKGTYVALGIGHKDKYHIVADRTLIKLEKDLQVLCFSTIHDAEEPLGFIVRDKDEYLLFCTDSKVIKQRFNLKFSIIAIECSYDCEILMDRVQKKTINEVLARRLLNSHMEKSVSLSYIQEYCDLSKCHEIHLLHMSEDNIDKEKTRAEFENELMIKMVVV